MNQIPAAIVYLTIIAILISVASAQVDLRDVDLSDWSCFSKQEGTAKTPDGQERNRMKNREQVDLNGSQIQRLDTPQFLEKVGKFDRELNATKRIDLSPDKKERLRQFENQVVCLTGYLNLCYPGPPETTNCGDRNLHDWHLEIFEKPSDHHPQVGDQQTPIICEVAPRTEGAIYRSGIRLQELSGFFRAGKEYISMNHPPRMVRVTGYLMWDDDHNGTADVGPTIDYMTENGYHHPWRSTAWEIHPILKVEVSPNEAQPAATPISYSSRRPVTEQPAQPKINTPQDFIVLTRAVIVGLPGEDKILQPGERLEVTSMSSEKIRIRYEGKSYEIPEAAIK